ncbi:MAG: arginine N-succinyltransferase, partial [Halobacteriovoraceae bacterium]|nr:arginine N-succinyltransferase [Halobacteriovoraceae bacterium]
FINLPNDRSLIKKKVEASVKTFNSPSKNLEENHYIFVLEDLEHGKIIGASMIHGKHGTSEEPHFYLTVSREHKFSKTINTGFIHGTLKLGVETNGWSEIGGLVLNPSFRGHAEKLGKQISYTRFLYMGLFPEQFTHYIHSELLPPFDSKGDSPLWEAIGRRFMNMNYQDADLLSRQNKEFILSLYPRDTIYETLLPPEARNSIGKVGQATQPVKKMLEKIGFHYTEEVDPFDGGPHYRARLKDIKPIKNMHRGIINRKEAFSPDFAEGILLKVPHAAGEFKAVKTNAVIKDGQFILPQEVCERFNLIDGQSAEAINI